MSKHYETAREIYASWGVDTEEAIRKMEASLCEMVIVGVETNVEEQLKLVRSKAFHEGEYDTLILNSILERK